MKIKNKRIYIIGIGGISMSAIALLLQKNGNIISGSDMVFSSITQNLETKNIKIHYNHKAENIKNIDIVLYSAAIKEDNPEMLEAKKKNIN